MQGKGHPPITTLFLDIGVVLLTNGWDHHARWRAAETFKLDWDEMEDRHRLNFATHEEGKLTIGEYLDRVVFHQKRPFTLTQFRRFMFTQSQPYPEMIELVCVSRQSMASRLPWSVMKRGNECVPAIPQQKRPGHAGNP